MSTERQRDAETDRLLRATLQPGVHADACPDADMLAAYAERALSPSERDALDVHFADCHRCQEALAFMARAWPAPDAAQPSTPGRWWSLRMRWLVPVAAAAVVVMYVAVRPVIAPYFPPMGSPSEVEQSPAPERVMADARPQEREAITAEADASGTGQNTLRRSADAKSTVPVGDAGIPPSKSRGADQPTLPGTPEDKRAGRMGDTSAGLPVSGTSRAEQTALPKALEAQGTARARETAAGMPAAADSARPSAAAVNEARPDAPSPAAFAAAPAAARAEAADAPRQQLAMKASASPPRDVVSPDGSVMWRIAPGGRVLRSTDRGTTWQPQSTGVSEELLAGSASSATVCWIVGRGATVIVTTDGARWTPHPFSERVDLVAVEAADARSATVTTRDGRRFFTLNGGATWSAK